MHGRLILVALLYASVSTALARPVVAATTPSQEDLARSHFVAGEEEYARGRWQDALHEFQLGYALSPRPEFLINFAQVYRKLGDYDAATRECQRYLATAPPSELAAQAQRLLEQITEERRSAPPPPPLVTPPPPPVSAPVLVAAPPPPPAKTKRRAWIAPVVVAGMLVVAGAVVVGVVFGVPARDTFKPTPLGTVDFPLMRATAAIAVAAALVAGCTQSGTGVELFIDAGSLTLDRLHIIASYDGNDVPHDVSLASTTTLDVVAQLPDESTTVTFDVTAFNANVLVGHGQSSPIHVTPHHLAQAMITLTAGLGDGGSDDLATAPPIDLAGTGALWSHQQGALPPSAGAVRGLWASSGTDVYAVGTATGGVNAFHSSDHGMHWSPQLAGGVGDLNAVAGTSSSDVYLVGDGNTILHGSGTTWNAQTSPASSATRLLSIWPIATGDLYIAGSGNTILHSAGGGWVLQTVVGTTELRGVWGVAGHIWAVGSGGTILKSTGGGSWTPETSGTPNELRAIFGTSATDLWVVGDGIVLHSDGGGSWTAAADGVPADVNLLAVGGRPGGSVWAVGNAWTIVRRDTSAWVVEPTGLTVDDPAGDVLQAIFAPSSAEVFAGGAGQTILHRP